MKRAEGPQGYAAKPAQKREGVEPHPISLCTHDDGRNVLLASRSWRRRAMEEDLILNYKRARQFQEMERKEEEEEVKEPARGGRTV